MMGGVVKMSDVALEAGVSKMTVSNVINGRPGASDETRARVLEAVARLGYRVNATARQLRPSQSSIDCQSVSPRSSRMPIQPSPK